MSSNIRALAAKTIYNVIFKKQSLDEVLSLNIKKCDNKKDESLLREISYGSLRWYHRLNKFVVALVAKPMAPSEDIISALLIVGFYQLLYLRIPEYAAISETVNAARYVNKPYAAKLINGVLRNFLREKENLINNLKNTEYSHPAWFIKAMQKSWPDYWQQILAANNERPPMSLRININKITSENYLKLLADADILAHLDSHTKTGIILEQGVDVNDLPLFQEGAVYIQDIASQFAVGLLDLQPGQRVLDACAAPGGKLTHILQAENALKEVIALDIDKHRLEKIKENLERLHLGGNVKLVCGDASKPSEWWNGEKFDRILLDAPCSATGVIRRHPDIKVLRVKSDISNLQKQQLCILESLWPLLKPDGILLYSTCSIFPDESNDVIELFLGKCKNVQEKIIDAPWGIRNKFGRQIITGSNSMDGFYYAKLIMKNE